MDRPGLATILLIGVLSSGCAAQGDAKYSYLDPDTGVTISRARTPLVFYKDRTSRAAFARDFIQVGPVEVNRMGALRYYLWFGIWSTIPVDEPGTRRDGFESVTLFVNGEPLPLQLAGWTSGAIGAGGDVYVRPVASAADAFYEVTIDQVRLVSGASDLRILTSGANPASFELWDGQQSALGGLREFVSAAGY